MGETLQIVRYRTIDSMCSNRNDEEESFSLSFSLVKTYWSTKELIFFFNIDPRANLTYADRAPWSPQEACPQLVR